jgi:chemotaxis protein histidine kinase CheA
VVDLAKYRVLFLEEATEHLAEMSRACLELEKEPANGEAIWGEPLGPHTLENIGPSPLRIISVEMKA